jgi:sensor histidine kinase regulating citrate/malate metabolism
MEKGKPMMMLVILAIMVGAALAMAAVAHIRRSRENKEPIQLGVGRKLHF